jgi:hypothetical protein
MLIKKGFYLKYLYFVLMLFVSSIFLSACSSKSSMAIYDLKYVPQNIDYYTKNLKPKNNFFKIQKKYEEYYFNVWNIKENRDSVEEAKWPFNSFKASKSYGANLQPLKQSFFDRMYENANFSKYSSINKRAITLRETNIRAFPTILPLFLNPNKAGEGYPFDYLQNSTVHANKPIFISHYSKDKEWAYISTSFTSGWIKISEFVTINKRYTRLWQKAQQISIIKEGVSIYDTKNNFLFKSKIGMMFALISENRNNYTVLVTSSYKGNIALFTKSKISKNIASKGPLKFTKKNISKIVNEVSKTTYGWGGSLEQRDCSSMLRDMYAPFGIWLPRNSSRQAKVGRVINLEGLDEESKLEKIKKEAVPFETLLYKQGHILLYVGTYNNEVIAFHNVWGIKSMKDNKEGRIIIGRPIFSTLELGKYQKYYDETAKILTNIKSMNILTQ